MKKLLSAVVGTAFAAALTLGAVSAASQAEEETPRIYVNIVELSDTQARADVMMENIPENFCGGFHLHFSEDWTLENVKGLDTPKKQIIDHTLEDFNIRDIMRCSGGPNDLFITYGSSYMENLDVNGCFISFFLNKTDEYSEEEANAYAYFTAADFVGSYTKEGGFERHFMGGSDEKIKTPDCNIIPIEAAEEVESEL